MVGQVVLLCIVVRVESVWERSAPFEGCPGMHSCRGVCRATGRPPVHTRGDGSKRVPQQRALPGSA